MKNKQEKKITQVCTIVILPVSSFGFTSLVPYDFLSESLSPQEGVQLTRDLAQISPSILVYLHTESAT